MPRISSSIGVTTSGGAYASGDVVGDEFTLTFPDVVGDGSVILQGATIVFLTGGLTAANAACDVYLYKGSVTAAADNAAFAPSDAESAKLVAVLTFAAANFLAPLTNNAVATIQITNWEVPTSAGTLTGVVVTRGAGTLGSTADGTLYLNYAPANR